MKPVSTVNSDLLFGDIVVVEGSLIGVVVKAWDRLTGENPGRYYEIYVRNYRTIKEYEAGEVERYRVRHKYLDQEELGYQNG